MHFQRMPTILIAVGHIVEQVDNARQDAKHHERKTRLGEGMKIEETPPEDDPRQQQDVLGPLAGRSDSSTARARDMRSTRGAGWWSGALGWVTVCVTTSCAMIARQPCEDSSG